MKSSVEGTSRRDKSENGKKSGAPEKSKPEFSSASDDERKDESVR